MRCYASLARLSGNSSIYLSCVEILRYFRNGCNWYLINNAGKIVMVCWMLWKNKNDLVWDQHSLDSVGLMESIISILNQLRSVQDKTFWPLYADAAIFTKSDLYIYAFVVRDHDDRLVEAVSKCRRGNLSPDLAETLSIMRLWVGRRRRTTVMQFLNLTAYKLCGQYGAPLYNFLI